MSRALVSIFVVSVFALTAIQEVSAQTINIALVNDGDSEWTQHLIQNVERELNAMADDDFNFNFTDRNTFNLNWDPSQAKATIDRALASNNVDIVIALGVLASAPLGDYMPNKPAIAALVIDPLQQGFPISERTTSGVKNLHYLSPTVDLVNEVVRFQGVTQANHIAVVADGVILEAIPALESRLNELAQSQEAKISVLRVNRPVDALAALPSDTDAVFALPQVRATGPQIKAMVDGLKSRAIPSYTMMGETAVQQGFVMGRRLVPTPDSLARQLAVDVRDIVLGRSAGDLPVTMKIQDRWVVNIKAAREARFDVPFDLIINAKLINEDPPSTSVMTLQQAVDQALKTNLSLAIAQEDFHLAEEDARIARSALLPQLNGEVAWESLDRDLAGTGPRRSTDVGLSFSQSIFSETSRSEYTASRFIRDGEAANLEATRLDTIEDTATAYINVLLAQTELDIQRDNLNLTRANLERAEFRYSVGATDRSEVHRFETELGNDQQAVASAYSERELAQFELNRVLRQPIMNPVRTAEPGLTDPKVFGDPRLQAYLRGPAQIERFGRFLADQSLNNSPELVSIQAQIQAQERLVLAAKRKRYVPELDLVSGVNRVVDDHDPIIDRDYDNDWSVGLQLTLPLYQGSRIAAERRQAEYELARLELTFEQQANIVETAALSALSEATASRLTIDFAKASADAAERTLSLVTDSYVRGASSYIDLIDAQSAYLTARLTSSNADFQHLQDLIELQRTIGFFDFYVSAIEEDAWFDALLEFERTYEP